MGGAPDSDDPTVDVFMSQAEPVDVLERREALAAVERGLFGRPAARPLTFGRFVLLEKLGSGGGGLVHAAYDPELDRKVAIKLLHPGKRERSAEARARLLREAQAIASLSHPNVLSIFDVGTFDEAEARELPGVSGSGVYLVMELVDGPDLRTWLREAPRTTRDILDAFTAAAEGIAAAHDKEIIHRDIKPSNILMGSDGRPRVLDFGLARKLGTPSEPSPGSSAALDISITADGVIMGTPAYMAPEQHDADDTDERTDQYAFCVALYEALHGQRPFGGKDPETLAEAKKSGRLPPVPEGKHVPRWLREVLARGLAVDPRRRYPNMRALVVALRDDPVRKWGRRGTAAAVVAAVVGLAGTTYRATTQQEKACDASAEVTTIWDDAARAEMTAAFDGTGIAYAGVALAGAVQALEDWTDRWQTARESACRATMVEGSQSVAEMSRAALCLERQLQRAGGVVGVLRTADAAVVERAARIVADLPDLTPCQVSTDRTETGGATTPEARARALDIERRIARGWALDRAGRLDEAEELARGAMADARNAGDRGQTASATALLGSIAQLKGRGDEARRLLREAVVHAEAADDELTVIDTTLTLAFGTGIHDARPDEALHLVELARARLAKYGNLPAELGRIEYIRGRVLEAAGRNEEALAAYEGALQIYEPVYGPLSPRVMDTVNNLGVAHDRLGHYEQALAYYERALEARTERFGEAHNGVANALGNVGATYDSLGRHREAIEPLRQSIARYRASLGPDNRMTAWYHGNLAQALLHVGELEEAREQAEITLDIRERVLGPEHPHSGMAYYELSQILAAQGEPDAAVARAEVAVERLRDWTDRSLLGHARHALAWARYLQDPSHPDREEVRVELEEALGLLEESLGPDHVETTRARMSLAELALASGNRELARQRAARALEILEKSEVHENRRKPARELLTRITSGGDAPR